MVHFTCDLCGKEMSTRDRDRYVALVEIRPTNPGDELTEEDLEEDNLAEVSKLLKHCEATGQDPFEDAAPVRNRYDLCGACRDKVLKSPFNCQPVAKLNFSDN